MEPPSQSRRRTARNQPRASRTRLPDRSTVATSRRYQNRNGYQVSGTFAFQSLILQYRGLVCRDRPAPEPPKIPARMRW